MASQDDVVRAQARALIQVLKDYNLDRWGASPLWPAVESFGRSGGTAAELQAIGRKYGGTAAAAFCAGVKLRAPDAALFLALSAFIRASPAYRFLDPSRWIALCFAFRDEKAAPDPAIQGEVLERLEAALAIEINDNCDRVAARRYQSQEVHDFSL
jgi:hypothetical protein